MIQRIRFALAAVVAASAGAAQGLAQTAPVNGMRPAEVRRHAIIGATVVVKPGFRIEDATIVIADGVITDVGTDVAIPAGARRWPADGLTVYPGLIDPAVMVEVETLPEAGVAGAHWNAGIHPQVLMSEHAAPDKDLREELRTLGFAVAAVYPSTGILRGSGAVVALADEDEHAITYDDRACMAAGFTDSRGWTSPYPTSLMGTIALLRQTLYDAQWHAECERLWQADPTGLEPPIRADALTALHEVINGDQPLLLEVRDEHDALRAAAVIEEFDLPCTLLGSGYEFRRLDAIAATGLPVVVPLEFPERPDVSSIPEADNVTLREMLTWEQAPTNPRRLVDAGVTVALTTHGLKKRDAFAKSLHKAVEHGLSEDQALATLTTTPARLLGLEEVLGTIEPGKAANLVVVEGSLFDRKPEIRATWVNGRRYEVADDPTVAFEGPGTLTTSLGLEIPVELDTTKPKLSVETPEGKTVKADKTVFRHDHLTVVLDGEPLEIDGYLRLNGVVTQNRVSGTGAMPDGEQFTFAIEMREKSEGEGGEGESEGENEGEGEGEEEPFEMPPDELVFPLGAFGFSERPEQQDVLLTNATIWTCGPKGLIEHGAMLVRDGRVAKVGRADRIRAPRGVPVIDLAGAHITPGLVDCHSHTGISGGVNEGGQAVTAEVRIRDVINPDDINLYRELAGGLTAANQLHGSANPIGGQNSVIKLRWSGPAAEFPIPDAIGGIKFALGENVKRTQTRYPNTRMGVETMIRDALTAAREYKARWDEYESGATSQAGRCMPPRRDLELDALVEVIEGERLVHCHSYRQDEILMLIRLADEFGFTIGTFQHVLEGYKVADAIAEHGAGASSFSDWWAYKVEVMDAIPFNGALMDDVGVVVSFNSDSSELARRMNTEAAKAVRYGGLEPHDALALVTINPARQLRVDHRIGSLEEGKDADFAVWSESPLSTYAMCQQTWIEGARYFDLDTDRELRARAEAERQRLIAKILKDDQGKGKGDGDREEDGEGKKPQPEEPEYSCCRRHEHE